MKTKVKLVLCLGLVTVLAISWMAYKTYQNAHRPMIWARQVDDYPLTESGWTPHRWAFINPTTQCPICGQAGFPDKFTSARKPCDCCGSDLGWVDVAWTYSPCGHELIMRLPCRALKIS